MWETTVGSLTLRQMFEIYAGGGGKCTLEFATFPDREDKDDATSSMECCIEFLFIHRQR